MPSATASVNYNSAESIQVLEGLEPVRKRPAMYIGGTDKTGLHHLVWEIIDNAVDEYINGFGDEIKVVLHKSGDAVAVSDNGRGIPVDLHPKHKKTGLELVLTVLHAGAKFGDGDTYLRSGGLHGVGASVVNALSKKMTATVRRDGFEWQMVFRRGKPTGDLQQVRPFRGHGTTVYFEPDPDIFKSTQFDPALIRARLEDMSYVHSGLKITFVNEVAGETLELAHPGGIPEFLARLVGETGKPAVTESPFTVIKDNGDKIEVALQWTEATDEVFRSYANGIRTAAGGTHENGLKSAIGKAVRNYMETHEVKVKGVSISAEDIREGVVGVLSVLLREPQFQGQTKEKLLNPDMAATVDNAVRPAFEAWLNNNRTAADQIVGRIVLAAKARAAARGAADEVKRKSPSSRRLSLPGKLRDCRSTDVKESELFIVEGDSAGGSATQGRNNATQAVLPLRGKVLNSEGLALSKVLTNQELKDLVTAIGTGAGEKFDLGGLRYGKIILLMDADADGNHIATLLLDFFFRHMTELVKKGHVYIAQPPLYRIDVGKETFWARDDAHKEEILSKLRANAKPEVSRFKGLGEMDPPVLAQTTLDPRKRTLLKVEIDSLLDADRTFADLLGNDPKKRAQFILEQAVRADVEELDL
jgi:DNA gyrase/topoisomerase IV subunit B